MTETAIFRGLREEDIKKITRCLGIKKEKFNPSETILSHNRNMEIVGILLSGTAELSAFDYDGNRMLLERYEKDSVFGELFSPSFGPDAPSVIATTPCEVLFLQYKNILMPCDNACDFHSTFLHNVIRLLTDKLRVQASHIEVLSKRSLRGKLLTYFESLAREKGSRKFFLPFSLYALADYLSIDRSAMQREMKKMRDEGIIFSKGKRIELLF